MDPTAKHWFLFDFNSQQIFNAIVVEIVICINKKKRSIVTLHFRICIYLQLTDTNFADVHHMTSLLENLVNAFQVFRAHEQIENKYIMKKLKAKLNALSIRSSAVCNCHSDNKLTEMLTLLQDGYQCRDKSEVDRQNYGIKLRTALEDFTQEFIPHMEEEEKVCVLYHG